jgi:calcineurin-like phosphoesterase family protein
MKVKKFAISDTHFFHDNIIKYCSRPFTNSDEMNAVMIQNWNKVVSPNDEVYVVGDFALVKGQSHEEKLQRLNNLSMQLNGKKHLIYGNHDYFTPEEYLIYGGFEEVGHGYIEVLLNNHWFTMCHYQMTSWNSSHHGSMHLFGHEHWRQQYEPKHSMYEEMHWSERKFNVCADANKFTPVDINDIIRVLEARPTNFNK